MGVLNNSRLAAATDNIIIQVINHLNKIKDQDLLDNNVFIELFNHIPHVQDEFDDYETWTLGQKRAFLKQIAGNFSDAQLQFLLQDIKIDTLLSQENTEEKLNQVIFQLKDQLTDYIYACQRERAVQHASLMGSNVAKELSKINASFFSAAGYQQELEKIAKFLEEYTTLFKAIGYQRPIIKSFLESFAEQYQQQLKDLLPSDSQHGDLEKDFLTLQKAVFEAFDTKIKKIFEEFLAQMVDDQDTSRNRMLTEEEITWLSIFVAREEIDRNNIVHTFQKASSKIQEQINTLNSRAAEEYEARFLLANTKLQGYLDQLQQYSGIEGEEALLENIKTEVQSLIGKLHIQEIEKLAIEARFDRNDFYDQDSALFYLGTLKDQCVGDCENVKNKAQQVVSFMRDAIKIDSNIKTNLQENNARDFENNMRELSNDIPHYVREIFKDTNKKITTGSSRFF